MDINQVFLAGRIAKDPETKYTSGGMAITEFTLVTTRWTKKGEEFTGIPEWHNCKALGESGEKLANDLQKGMHVSVVGRIQYSSWGEGENKKYKTEIMVDRASYQKMAREEVVEDDEELPF